MTKKFLQFTSHDIHKRPVEIALNMEQIGAIYFYEQSANEEASAVVHGNGFSFRTYDTLQIEILQDYTRRF